MIEDVNIIQSNSDGDIDSSETLSPQDQNDGGDPGPIDVRDLSESYLNLVPGVRSAIEKLSESLVTLQPIEIGLSRSVLTPIANMQKSILKAASATINISQAFAEALKPVYDSFTEFVREINWERLSKLREVFDWESLQDGARRWGEFGWAISDLTPSEIRNAPETLAEADSYYIAYMSNERMSLLFERVLSSISKKKDFEECMELFRARHYKPCAMMLCSLIDGQLIKRLPRSSSWRNGRTALKLSSEISDDVIGVMWAQKTISAYDYFFQSGKNFNRDLEGELNRNFLMHGMMYKPVRKKSCIKLFLLLEAVVISTD